MIYLVLSLILLNSMAENLAHAASLAGARMHRLMLANSVFNIVLLAAGLAMSVQAPLTASLVDSAVHAGDVDRVLWYCRAIITARAIGYAVGMFLIPWFARIIELGVWSMENNGGFLLHAMLDYLHPRNIAEICNSFSVLTPSHIAAAFAERFPRRVFVTAVSVAAFYSAVDMAALYVSGLSPQWTRTAIALPTALRGFGTMLFVFLVDPFASRIIDRSATGELNISVTNHIVIWLSSGKTLGTVFAQFLFLPFTQLILLVIGVLT